MSDSKKTPVSFDQFVKAGREKKKHEQLAQAILGSKRRSSAPGAVKKGGLGASLASRVGVTKRPTSLSRSHSSQAKVPQQRQLNQERPLRTPAQVLPPVRPAKTSTQTTANGTHNTSGGLSIKGAASGPFIVIASNFAVGTSSADIESVMASVGGELVYCKLVASSPTVIAEMGFKERTGADAVISTFNNKKADGRLLYVHMKDGSVPSIAGAAQRQKEAEQAVDNGYVDDAMELDENAKSREAADRLREERRGGRPEAIPSGPRRSFRADDEYYHNSNAPQTGYGRHQDSHYGSMGSRRRGGGWFEDRRGFRA